MLLPFNCAVLKLFTRVEEACADDVMNALKSDYGKSKVFSAKEVREVLAAAVVNEILEETRCELDKKDVLRIYYQANRDGKDIINKYLPN